MFNETYEGDWITWECPVCKSEHQDPEHTAVTTCENGHMIQLLGNAAFVMEGYENFGKGKDN